MGLILNGATIDNTVVGGPAFNSKKISHGDVILKVNQESINDHNAIDIIVGDDIPGSVVQLTIAKGGRNVLSFVICKVLYQISTNENLDDSRVQSKTWHSRGWRLSI